MDTHKTKTQYLYKKHSDTTQANRIDAEYYQPKYDAILEKITSYKGGYKAMGENMRSALHKINPEQSYSYIELATIDSQGFINDTEPTLGKDLPSRARRIVNIGDVLISSVEGSLNKSALVDIKLDQFVCSTGFYILSACNQLNSETLFMYFRLPFIRELLAQMCKGTILTAFDQSSLENFVIPILDKKIQDEIAIKITNAHQSRQESKRLLKLAKSTVEHAIEHGETKK